MMLETQAANAASGRGGVMAAIREASLTTGSDFDYLLSTAMRESSLKPDAESKTSSATGLFQFIDQTWLGLVKQFGERHGLAKFSDAIHRDGSGRFSVLEASKKGEILALRKDPALSALMAGEAVNQTKLSLEATLGREVSCGELYAAHFLGQGGACRLINAYESDPSQRADQIFPEAAAANRAVFYKPNGRAKSVGELYASVAGGPAPSHPPQVPVAQAHAGVAPTRAAPGLQIAASALGPAPDSAPSSASKQDAAPEIRLRRLDAPSVGMPELEQALPAHAFGQARAVRMPVATVQQADVQLFEAASRPASTGLPQPPLMLSAGVIEILASLGGTLFTARERES